MTTSLAVLGSPIEHSLSPALHSAAYASLGLEWNYTRYEVVSGELKRFLATLDDRWRGLSLTMPLKREVLPLLDTTDDVARAAHSVNTVLIHDGKYLGFNTDVYGVVQALADAGVHSVANATILGAGATAASVIAALAEIGCTELTLVARTPERADFAASLAESAGLRTRVRRFETLPVSDIVVSTLPGGTRVDPALFHTAARGGVLFDVAYSPWPSTLAQLWQAGGGRAVSGLGMLVHQALRQVRIFVGKNPDLPLANETKVLRAMASAVDYRLPTHDSAL